MDGVQMRELTDRVDLAGLFFELGYTAGAEIGVLHGDYSKDLLGKNPNLILYCIDPWEPYIERASSRKNRIYYKRAVARLSKFANARIIRKRSADALNDFPDESLDFVYIDAIHDYENVRFDVTEWSKKVRIGGIVSGHDYCNVSHPLYEFGVIQAVDEYVKANNQDLVVIGGEQFPTWFWMKR
jgi:predicted O-methyltransferase YrrM